MLRTIEPPSEEQRRIDARQTRVVVGVFATVLLTGLLVLALVGVQGEIERRAEVERAYRAALAEIAPMLSAAEEDNVASMMQAMERAERTVAGLQPPRKAEAYHAAVVDLLTQCRRAMALGVQLERGEITGAAWEIEVARRMEACADGWQRVDHRALTVRE